MIRHRIPAALAIAAVAAWAMSMPAQATGISQTLPDGYTMYALPCDDLANAPAALYRVDPATASLERVGPDYEGMWDYQCWSSGIYVPEDGLIWAVDTNAYTNDNGGTMLLRSIDPETGVVTPGPRIYDDADNSYFPFYTIFKGPDGLIYATGGRGSSSGANSIYRLDLSTGAATFISNTRLNGNLVNNWYLVGTNPVDGLVYGSPMSGEWYTIDIATGALTAVTEAGRSPLQAVVFDETGAAWTVSYSYPAGSFLNSGTFPAYADTRTTTADAFNADGQAIGVAGLVLVPDPEPTPEPTPSDSSSPSPSTGSAALDGSSSLAATGADSNLSGLLAFGAIALGGLSIWLRRRGETR
ncbi:MAG TPA: LPXTG cell wall anchor domain-containing protein [Microbacteriaceae bacterium]|nr:LPXTG cell wall anchor domain-containing protein [Microbacteriaceae bacterium]